MKPIRRNIFLLASTALAFSVVLAGCSSGSSSSASSAPATTPASTATGSQYNAVLHDSLPADIIKKGSLTLATDPTDPPLEFYNDSNQLIGAEVDMAAAIGQVLGVKVQLVPAKFDAIIPGIQAGRYDASVSGFADRAGRQKIVDFVDYFTSSRAYLFETGKQTGLETATNLCGKSVAVAKGTTMADSIVTQAADCLKTGKAKINAQIYPDQNACVLAVQSGRAQLTILSDHVAFWIAKTSKGVLDVALRPDQGQDINGIAVKKGGLVTPIQKAIQQLMDGGTFVQIYTKWNLQKLILTTATVNAGVK